MSTSIVLYYFSRWQGNFLHGSIMNLRDTLKFVIVLRSGENLKVQKNRKIE